MRPVTKTDSKVCIRVFRGRGGRGMVPVATVESPGPFEMKNSSKMFVSAG